MSTYLIVFQWILPNDLIKVLDESGKIKNWLLLWPGAMICQGFADVEAVSDCIHGGIPSGHFIVTEVKLNEYTKGWMGHDVWDFISLTTDNEIPSPQLK